MPTYWSTYRQTDGGITQSLLICSELRLGCMPSSLQFIYVRNSANFCLDCELTFSRRRLVRPGLGFLHVHTFWGISLNKNFTLIYRLIYTFSVKVNTANSVAEGSQVKSGEKLFQPVLQIAMILRAKAKRHQPFGIITIINNLEICIVPIRKNSVT